MHMEAKLIIQSDIMTSCDMSSEFHKIDTNSQKFYAENLVFKIKGFIWKFSTTKI